MKLKIGYCRVSTTSSEQQQALPVQRHRIEREGCELILSDSESGMSTERPGYVELRRLVAAGQALEVVATEFSRLGRQAREADAFVSLCDSMGTVCRTLSDGVLTMSTPEGLLMTRLKGSLSEGESMRIKQRIRRGLEEGRVMGKPMRKPPWGYQLKRDRSAFEPDPEQFPIARQFLDALRAREWRISPTLTEFRERVPFRSLRGVRAWVMNPTLRGGIGYKQKPNHVYEEILWNRHEPLMSHSDYEEFMVVTEQNRKRWGINCTTRPRALTSLCRCTECNCALKYIGGREIPSLKCSGFNCSQYYKGTREELIIRYALEAVTAQAALALASAARGDDPLEVIELRDQIRKIETLGDPDLEPAIRAKRIKLESLMEGLRHEPELLEKIADPRWTELASYEEVRVILQRLVIEIEITRQAPTAIRLRL
jgi:DNA invertase Pin-like site-specific DNA recombinase